MRWVPPAPRPLRVLLSTPRVARARLLMRRAVREHLDDHCQQLAAAISYHLLFSLFPLAIAATGILGLVTSDPARRNAVINAMLSHVPLNDSGRSQLHDLLTSVNGRAGALGLIGCRRALLGQRRDGGAAHRPE